MLADEWQFFRFDFCPLTRQRLLNDAEASDTETRSVWVKAFNPSQEYVTPVMQNVL